jgi:hypothetical protein
MKLVAPRLFSHIHGLVGMAQQVVSICIVIRIKSRPDACRYPDIMAIDIEGLAYLIHDPRQHLATLRFI